MITTKEARKEKAIELMKKLDIYAPYIKDFQENDITTYFDRYIGFWSYQDEELNAKIKEVEEKFGCTVYAITHEFLQSDECYSFLVVPQRKSDWHDLVEKYGRVYNVFAYVWNKSYEPDSEFGTISVDSFGGGIRRRY